MSEQTPSQAEGERPETSPDDDEQETSGRRDVPRTTPSQAEGEDEGTQDAAEESDGSGS